MTVVLIVGVIIGLVITLHLVYSIGHWNGSAAAHRYHVDRLLERSDEQHFRR